MAKSKKQFIPTRTRFTPRQVAQVSSLPAPVGGLNAIDPIAAMPPQDAIQIENFFPTQYSVNARNGAKNHVTGIVGIVNTLMTYRSSTATKMFAVVDNGSIYDVTTAGTVGAAVVTGLSSSKMQYVNIATPATNYLYAFNGVDAPRLYNGSTWTAITGVSTPAITGVTTTKLTNPELFKNRLFMVEKDSSTAWYLPVQSVGGAAAALYLGSYFRLGGYLLRVFNASVATANQIGDYIGFLSSEGEILIFQGTDPTSDFNLVGSYRVGRPVGERCIFRIGSDVFFVTTSGIFGLSKLYQDNNDNANDAISYKILPLLADDTQTYFSNFGWQGIFYPTGNKLIVNVPTKGTVYAYQYVMNTLTGAWCKFTGWSSYCYELMGNNIYYGGNGIVAQCDVDNSDFGNAIQAVLKPAFSYFGTQQNKMFTMVRPIISSNATISYNITMNYDFIDNGNTVNTITANVSNLWDTTWDVAWSSGDSIQQVWRSVTGSGYTAAPRIDLAYRGSTFKVQSFDYVWQVGGVL